MKTLKMNIVLIDNHRLLTECLSSLLIKCDFVNELTAYQNPKKYLEDFELNEPDILISDILLSEMNGIELLLELKKKKSKSKIIILSAITEMQTIRHAMRSGANGYLSKNISIEEFKEAILSVYNDEPYICESLRKKLVRSTLIEDRFLYNLSPREKEVLNFVCSGKTIKETAFDMQLSPSTVQTYYKTILRKFNLKRTADLIVFAMQNGLILPKASKVLD